MGLSNKLNAGGRKTVRDGVDTKELTYVKAAELGLAGPPYPIRIIGFFIKDGEYGEGVTLVVKEKESIYGVNLPKRYVEKFKSLSDEEVSGLISGDTGISDIRVDVKTPKGKTTMIEFCDMEPDA